MSDLISLEQVSAGYGRATILDDISFSLAEGHNLALLGRNGVGKSTLALTLMGHTILQHGRIMFRGNNIASDRPFKRVVRGLAWVPQERETFPSLTIDEHLSIATRKGSWTRARIYQTFPRLAERQNSYARQLSGGEQQMLAIARALITNPQLLILDEPLEGLAPIIVSELSNTLTQVIKSERMTVILIEQHTRFALSLASDAIVLERGRIAYSGPSQMLRDDPGLQDRLIGLRQVNPA